MPNYCHQCHHKKNPTVSCKAKNNDKPCTYMYCYNCLRNRYDEKAEDVESLEDWKCPMCRGDCDCSNCMRKRGEQPKGRKLKVAADVGTSLKKGGAKKIKLDGEQQNISLPVENVLRSVFAPSEKNAEEKGPSSPRHHKTAPS